MKTLATEIKPGDTIRHNHVGDILVSYIQSIMTPQGDMLMFFNEYGHHAYYLETEEIKVINGK